MAGKDNPVLFVSRTGQSIMPKKLSDRVIAYIVAANLGKTGSCHRRRHMSATLMLEGWADIRLIQALLGHENLNTTQIYTQVSITHLQAVHAQTQPEPGHDATPVRSPHC